MKGAFDSSILVAALAEAEIHHAACAALLAKSRGCIFAHALTEVFNTLTGGRSGYRIAPQQAAELIEFEIFPAVGVISLSPKEMITAMRSAHLRGVRGAAVFDFLHLVAAKKAAAKRLYTLNVSHFQSFHRPGDPEIVHP